MISGHNFLGNLIKNNFNFLFLDIFLLTKIINILFHFSFLYKTNLQIKWDIQKKNSSDYRDKGLKEAQ